MKMIFTMFDIELKRQSDNHKFLKELNQLCQKYAKPIKGEKYEAYHYGFIWEDQN